MVGRGGGRRSGITARGYARADDDDHHLVYSNVCVQSPPPKKEKTWWWMRISIFFSFSRRKIGRTQLSFLIGTLHTKNGGILDYSIHFYFFYSWGLESYARWPLNKRWRDVSCCFSSNTRERRDARPYQSHR